MTKRILVLIDLTAEIDRALALVRTLARDGGGVLRLITVIPIPKPVRDRRGRVVVSTGQQLDRLERRTTETLRALAAHRFEGVPVETSVVFGDSAPEIESDVHYGGDEMVVIATPPRRTVWAALNAATRALTSTPPTAVRVPHPSGSASPSAVSP